MPRSNLRLYAERRKVMSKKLPNVSIEKFAAYIDNNLPEYEMRQMDEFVNSEEDLQNIMSLNDAIDNYSLENSFDLPEDLMANSYNIPSIGTELPDGMEQILNDFNEIFHIEGDRFDETLGSIFGEQTLNDGIMNTNEAMNGYFGEINPIQQQYEDTCAIKAQQLILNDFNVPCSEDELVQYSIDHGWYNGDGNGTLMCDVGKLLIDGGVPCSRHDNANAFDLVNELAQGHKIIVGVDSKELWNNDTILGKLGNWFNDFFVGNTPDHALIVAGIDTTDPNNIKVLVTDPGKGDYHKAYPLEQFMDAWSDSNCFMVSTDVAVPQTSPQMENFDYNTGHIDDVAGVDYSQFQIFNDISHGVPCNYMDFNGQMFNPMNSYMDAYFDFAHNDMMFSDIFNHNNYMFNGFINQDLVMPHLHDSFDFGMNQIGFDMSNNWNQYAAVNGLDFMTNHDYSNFLDQSIMNFQMMGDYNSMAICEQQHMMLDYCNEFGLDFYDTFYGF